MYDKGKTVLVDKREMLRIKLATLVFESKAIRQAEYKAHSDYRNELHLHRVLVVRAEARDTGLALGFIRGRSLEQMEPTRETEPNWENVKRMVVKFGPVDRDYSHLQLPDKLEMSKDKTSIIKRVVGRAKALISA